MSLVNDLLIEVDRRREEAGEQAESPVDGLSPTRTHRRRRGRAKPLLLTMGVISLIALGTGIFFQVSVAPELLLTKTRPVERPAVGARPTETPRLPAAITADSDLSSKSIPEFHFARPVSIRGLSLEKSSDTTRLRIAADESTPYRIEGADTDRHLEIVLESAALRSALAPLDLIDTPIRSLETRRDQDEMHFFLVLDDAVRVQSQWVEEDDRSWLVVDLQSPKRSAPIADSDFSAALEARTSSSMIFADSGEKQSSAGIRRSADDQRRQARQATRNRAHEHLAIARFERDEGDLIEAMRLYRAALADLPELSEAMLELGALLVETGEPQEAIEMVRLTRRHAPHDARLALFHAQLVEQTGKLAEAIQILDQSDLELSEAPELHALAAAYVQQSGNHANAIDRYERIVRRFPANASWWMGLGISLEAEGRRAEAADVYRIAIDVGELSGPTRRWVSTRVEALSEEG